MYRKIVGVNEHSNSLTLYFILIILFDINQCCEIQMIRHFNHFVLISINVVNFKSLMILIILFVSIQNCAVRKSNHFIFNANICTLKCARLKLIFAFTIF